MRALELTGVRFGRYVVLRRTTITKRGNIKWLCRCDCGVIKEVQGGNLRSGNTISCGRYCKDAPMKHGHCRKRTSGNSPEYNSWANMKKRCSNHNDSEYHRYGGRGIMVCPRWRHDFLAFLTDIGRKPSPKHSVDRIDPDGNYSPENCKWSTPLEQSVNTRGAKSRALQLAGTLVQRLSILLPQRESCRLARMLYDQLEEDLRSHA